MDWFERLTGFREAGYEDTRRRLAVDGTSLVSTVNGRRMGIGTLTLPSLAELRDQVRRTRPSPGRLAVRSVVGDVRQLHRDPALRGALFQVASQFNLLEMVGPEVTPEHGVTIYEHDRTQGPACAIAAGAATIYRNYCVPVPAAGGHPPRTGQTAEHQLDGLADLGVALAGITGLAAEALWTMRNGYAMCTLQGLQAIGDALAACGEPRRDELRARLRIGWHRDVEVTDSRPTDMPGDPMQVSQAFCSALPVAYGRLPRPVWRPLAQLVLEAAYEATLQAAVLGASQGGSRVVLLTRLGGGAFGNHDAWIDAALRRALDLHRHHGLDVRLVSYGRADASSLAIERDYA